MFFDGVAKFINHLLTPMGEVGYPFGHNRQAMVNPFRNDDKTRLATPTRYSHLSLNWLKFSIHHSSSLNGLYIDPLINIFALQIRLKHKLFLAGWKGYFHAS